METTIEYASAVPQSPPGSALEVLGVATRLGLTSARADRSRPRRAAVVGLLLAALYRPVWMSAIHAPGDVALGLVDFLLLAFWKWPPWLVVVLSALGGAVLVQ